MKPFVFINYPCWKEHTSCKLKIHWYFKPHQRQSMEREKRIDQWEMKVKFDLAFVLNKRKSNAKRKDNGDNILDLCATKQWAPKDFSMLLDKTELFDSTFNPIKMENQA